MKHEAAELARRAAAGDERSLARLISGIEAGEPVSLEALRSLRATRAGAAASAGVDANAGVDASAGVAPPGARVVGVTGAPGSGKSTLVDALVRVSRELDRRVAVLAVDPSSPYTGGAILGDRIRMARWHADEAVFVRSMAARGHLGGLAAAALQVVALLEAVGFDLVLVETVGVGQSEVEVAAAVDTTVVVLTPGQGDGVQAVKAGLMEVADVFVVNKADQPGAERLVRDVRGALGLAGPPPAGTWSPPVLTSVATREEGVAELSAAIDRHREHLEASGASDRARRRRVRGEVRALVAEAVRRELARVPEEELDSVAEGERDARTLAMALLSRAADANA